MTFCDAVTGRHLAAIWLPVAGARLMSDGEEVTLAGLRAWRRNRRRIRAHRGRIVKSTGDGFLVVSERGRAVLRVRCSAMASAAPDPPRAIRVRMGVSPAISSPGTTFLVTGQCRARLEACGVAGIYLAHRAGPYHDNSYVFEDRGGSRLKASPSVRVYSLSRQPSRDRSTRCTAAQD